MRQLFATLLLASVVACGGHVIVGPDVPIDARVTLAPSEQLELNGGEVRVRFERVLDDSRCPAAAFCVQAGWATVSLVIFHAGQEVPCQVRTDPADARIVWHRNIRVELEALQPYPTTHQRIDPAAYRATLHITR